ncbi:hypothetical protein SPOG_04106 [Schizosaccharomyces cryophilus OY26]|uniref:Uncharacterized protein n=1 Tax=Schizosaccharomyces cryophilus (strain OY26 / ATCC MYA-4695 / CBS 11777 / NBRC 106824 / NRRL Y48691) TaxID=653667 RepID=S9W2E7_SCHCR|nr:uncharacterized protein SPOG_04106 [Schizosaccharomyces cryophilus OY26]EPY54213.1 hypothetical protein SPOG_04106 [Schizosaccharomyces cryophilus OY26]
MELSRYEKDKIISLKFLQLFFRLKNVFNIFFAMSFPIPFHNQNQSKIELIKKMNAVSPLHAINEQLNFWIKELETNGLVHFGWTKAKDMFEFSMSSINFLILYSQKPIFLNYSIRQEVHREQLFHELQSCKKCFFEIKSEANSFFCLQIIISNFMFNQIQYIQETCQNIIPNFQTFFCNICTSLVSYFGKREYPEPQKKNVTLQLYANIKPVNGISKTSYQKPDKTEPDSKENYSKEDDIPPGNQPSDEQGRLSHSESESITESYRNDLTDASNLESSVSSVTCNDFFDVLKNVDNTNIQEQPDVNLNRDHHIDKENSSRIELGKEDLEFERYNVELLQFQVAIGSLQTVHYEFQETLRKMQLLESTEGSICQSGVTINMRKDVALESTS